MPAVLLITKDRSSEELVRSGLAAAGYEVITATGSEAAIRSLFSFRVDAVVLDTALGEDLEWLCRRLRGIVDRLPVTFLAPPSARWAPGSLPFRKGLDELVIKPYSAQDVRRAVERVLGARTGSPSEALLVGELHLDRNSHEIRGDGALVQLTPTEFRLVEYLAQRRGSVASAEELLEKVWKFHPGTGSSEVVRSHVRNLRAKMRVAFPGREVIQTVPRRGYRLG